MSVSRNTLYNVAGALVPLLLALVTVPLYLQYIGEARYGVLAIVWLLLGYFGIFDLGLSHATANKIARLRDAPASEREEVLWTACLINAALGMLGGLILYLLGGLLLGHWFKMSGSLHVEALAALPWIAAAVPVATISGVLAGALEGRQQFGIANIIQALGTIMFQVVPLAAAVFISPKLQIIVPAAVIVRTASLVPLAFAVRSALPMHHGPRIGTGHAHDLLAYGMWITVTNFVSPLLASLDRFFIGVVLGAPAVAYYSVPFSLVGRTQILARALSRTLFPYLSAEALPRAKNRVLESATAIGAVMIPTVVVAIFALPPLLSLWIGATFASRAAPVGEVLLCGVWLNGLASIPLVMLQAQGRPDIVAKFHIIELAPFVGALWYGVHRFGLVGAAVAWDFRVGVDALLLFWAAGVGAEIAKRLALGSGLVLCAWLCDHFMPGPMSFPKMLVGAVIIISTSAWALRSSVRLRQEIKRALKYVSA